MFSEICIGSRMDILDKSDVYCPVEVLQNNITSIQVHYIGWDSAWDEEITDINRISIKTRFVKSWVRLHKDICLWPCVFYLRMPKHGSDLGENYLRTEERVLVFPYRISKKGGGLLAKYFKPQGLWVHSSDVHPFGTKHDAQRIKRGGVSKFKSYFLEAMQNLMQDTTAEVYHFHLEGTLDVADKRKLETISREIKDKQCGSDQSSVTTGQKRGIFIDFCIDSEDKKATTAKINSLVEEQSPRFFPFSEYASYHENVPENATKYNRKHNTSQIYDESNSVILVLPSNVSIASSSQALHPTGGSNRRWPSVAGINAVVSFIGQHYGKNDIDSIQSNPTEHSPLAKPYLNPVALSTSTILPKEVSHRYSALFEWNKDREIQCYPDTSLILPSKSIGSWSIKHLLRNRNDNLTNASPVKSKESSVVEIISPNNISKKRKLFST